jgi:hypothetical protein
MSYYYEPDYYAKEVAKSLGKNIEGLGGAIQERLKALEARIEALEKKK